MAYNSNPLTNLKPPNLPFRQKIKNFYSKWLVRKWTMISSCNLNYVTAYSTYSLDHLNKSLWIPFAASLLVIPASTWIILIWLQEGPYGRIWNFREIKYSIYIQDELSMTFLVVQTVHIPYIYNNQIFRKTYVEDNRRWVNLCIYHDIWLHILNISYLAWQFPTEDPK